MNDPYAPHGERVRKVVEMTREFLRPGGPVAEGIRKALAARDRTLERSRRPKP